jgi:hypothetical protein
MWSVKAVTTAWSLASGHHLVEAGVGRVWQPAALFEALDYAVLDRPQDRDELGEGGDVVGEAALVRKDECSVGR